MRIAYLVHNLADPAVAKRVRILSAEGDTVQLVGFRRDDGRVDRVADIPAVDLGRTYDASFVRRVGMVLMRCATAGSWARALRGCDVIIARNLEMLVLATAVRRRYARRAALVYESLDIHRLLLDEGMIGGALRAVERRLLRRANLVVVSSAAFLREYFQPRRQIAGGVPAVVVENKLLLATGKQPRSPSGSGLPAGPPWRIGWFGMIRCRKSLDLLCALAARRPDLLRVIIRGRPSRTEFADFDGQVAHTPGVDFGGLYSPDELASLYGGVHFNWAIDYFEEGANSQWLLPNRIYEGGAYRAVPIARPETETARWLEQRGIGVVLEPAAALEAFLDALTPESYATLKAAAASVPMSDFVADSSDCRRLLDALDRAIQSNGAAAGLRSVEFDLGEAGEARHDATV